MSPRVPLRSMVEAAKRPTTSLQTPIALFNFEQPRAWTVCVDGLPVTGLPATLRADQRITIRGGVTFLAVIPIPGTDLGDPHSPKAPPRVPGSAAGETGACRSTGPASKRGAVHRVR